MTQPRRRSLAALALAVALPGAGLLGAPPAGAEGRFFYATTTESRTFEFYEQLPYEATEGSPSSSVNLDDQQNYPFCETFSGVYDLGGVIDEFLSLSSNNVYQNPTRMRAANPPGTRPQRAEFNTVASGPHALSDCKTPTSGYGTATYGGHVADQVSVQSATSETTAARADGEDTVVGETTTKFQGFKAGDVSFRQLESWVKVEWRAGQQPLVTYRMVLNGLFNGTSEVMLNGGNGIVLSGQKVAGSELAEQFNQQSKAHQSDLDKLATYGFRILEPKVYQDPNGRNVVETYLLESGFGLAARKGDQIGNFQGLRLGVSRVSGLVSTN